MTHEEKKMPDNSGDNFRIAPGTGTVSSPGQNIPLTGPPSENPEIRRAILGGTTGN